MTICICNHAKSRHRQQYGEPHTGPCRDCECPVLVLNVPALSVREADVLEAVCRCEAVGVRSLELSFEDRMDGYALGQVLGSLLGKGLVTMTPGLRGTTARATPAGASIIGARHA